MLIQHLASDLSLILDVPTCDLSLGCKAWRKPLTFDLSLTRKTRVRPDVEKSILFRFRSAIGPAFPRLCILQQFFCAGRALSVGQPGSPGSDGASPYHANIALANSEPGLLTSHR
jgi:hypothetical protein